MNVDKLSREIIIGAVAFSIGYATGIIVAYLLG